jgi:hypothetical protein
VDRLFKSYERFFDGRKKGERVGLPGFRKVRHRFGGLQLEWLSMRISLPENFLINRNWARQHRWRFVQDARLEASRCPLGLIGL